jgi:hypothetical protein
MRKIVGIALVLLVGAGVGMAVGGGRATEADRPAGPMIGHMVYFQLTDNSPENVRKLVDACDKQLSGHPGEAFYSAGPRAKEFNRPVNDQDWDVALHIVFQTKADHDRYQEAPRHLQFIEENKANWKKVRVFDSQLASAKGLAAR